jgi:hypothetical protein
MGTKKRKSVAVCRAPEPAFRWGDFSPEDRDWLRKKTADIETFAYNAACNTVRMGQALAEVRLKLRRKFKPWLAAHTGISRSQAYRHIAAAAVFGPYLSLIETLEPYAMYVLAQKEVPQSAREYAVELARSGTPVTRARALEIIDLYRPVPDPTAKEVREYESLVKALGKVTVETTTGGTKKVDQDRHTAKLVGKDDAMYARIGRTFVELAGACSLLTVAKVDDTDDVVLYSITTRTEDDLPRNIVSSDMEYGLLRAVGREPKKVCGNGCNGGAPVCFTQFGANDTMPDRLNTVCKACERARKLRLRDEKRKKRDAESTGDSAPTSQG